MSKKYGNPLAPYFYQVWSSLTFQILYKNCGLDILTSKMVHKLLITRTTSKSILAFLVFFIHSGDKQMNALETLQMRSTNSLMLCYVMNAWQKM